MYSVFQLTYSLYQKPFVLLLLLSAVGCLVLVLPPPVDTSQYDAHTPCAGIEWFKLTFGLLWLSIMVPAMARFFCVRDVFEIRARCVCSITRLVELILSTSGSVS